MHLLETKIGKSLYLEVLELALLLKLRYLTLDVVEKVHREVSLEFTRLNGT
jgi:hypothetical protein